MLDYGAVIGILDRIWERHERAARQIGLSVMGSPVAVTAIENLERVMATQMAAEVWAVAVEAEANGEEVNGHDVLERHLRSDAC